MSPIVVSTAQAVTTDEQPAARTDMNISRPSPLSKQAHTAKAERLRGGGAGKDCFLGLVGCFLCFECCEGCCDCIGDIICCPCEMCC
ncbi:hypothetical protein CC2G_012569 [Coprinopsis cinerea AmutBmut pab1-1]|nr:hypothetical protein CC2G_012569 [Coprinopsis cinerea AmutBmut pab1-1]